MKAFKYLFLAVCVAAPFYAGAADINTADFDSDYSDAAQVRGSEAVKGTDLLVRDTTSVLHREHMAILQALAELRKEIADMKKDVKDTKDQVESGQ
ncbi:MAG: hypothetical protein WC481_04155 [Candidatus Omnitrophota bacterium]